MPSPRLFFGEGGGNALFRYGSDAATDDGASYSIVAESQAVAVGGDSGEVVATGVWLVYRNTMGTTLVLTPVLDDKRWDGTEGTLDLRKTITIAAQATLRRVRRELPLSMPVLDVLGREMVRVGLRASRLAFRLAAPIAAGLLEIEGFEAEVEAVGDTLVAETP